MKVDGKFAAAFIVAGFMLGMTQTDSSADQPAELPEGGNGIPDVNLDWRELSGTPGANPLTACYFETGMRIVVIPTDRGNYGGAGSVALSYDKYGCPNPGQPLD